MQGRRMLIFSFLYFFLAHCSDKGEAIVEPRLATYKFTTYTVDTFRFKITLNDEVLTDSLLSPIGSQKLIVKFIDSSRKLKIFNAKNNQLIIDSTIILKIGQSTISLVQFTSEQRPFIPTSPNEPPPSAGNVKVRFQYVQPSNQSIPFFDSIRCIIRVSSSTLPLDSIILKKYEVSRFYQVNLGSTIRMILYNPATGAQIDNTTNNLNLTGFSDFNTAIVYGQSPSGSQYNFSLQRIY